MKTNKIMIREMGSFEIYQRTKDGMFNVSLLAKQWHERVNIEKKVNHFLEKSSTKDFIEILYEDINSTKSESIDNQVKRVSSIPNNQVLKISGIIDKTNAKTDKRGKRVPGSIWFHPYLFMDFAMWLNPKFRLSVIKFVHDQLIEFRHNAGDYYKGLTSAISGFEGVDYAKVAKGLNYIIFDKHEAGLRQYATQAQLRALSNLQQQLAFAVNMGYIKSFNELLNEMRRIYNMRKKYFNI